MSASPSDLQAELNLRLKRTADSVLNDVRELEGLLRGRGALRAIDIESLRPVWASPDHRYVRLLASRSAAILSAPGVAGYMLESETPLATLKMLANRRIAQIRAEAREVIRLRRIIALKMKAAELAKGAA